MVEKEAIDIVIFGDYKTSGKTEVFKILSGKDDVINHDVSIRIDTAHRIVNIGGSPVDFKIWDTSG